MKTLLKQLSLSEVDEKNKMMVVRVSLDLYNLLQKEAEQLEITVSALVRSLFSFNYYPQLAELSSNQAREDLIEGYKQARLLDGGLAEYEARLADLAEDIELFGHALAVEQERVAEARKSILKILETLTSDSDEE